MDLRRALAVFFLLSLAACQNGVTSGGDTDTTSSSGTPSQTALTNLSYASLSSSEVLDLYVPAGVGPFPVVVYIHGGAFKAGDKSQPEDNGIVDRLLSEGYAAASLNYRLSGEALFPAQIVDAKAAVRWLRAHASEYRLDPEKFAAWGDSSGGNQVSLLGTSCGVTSLEGSELGNADQSSCVQAVVDYYGPTNFLKMDTESVADSCQPFHDGSGSPESKYMGEAIQEIPQLVMQANPVTYVTSDDPPFFIEHGTADCTVPYQQSELLYNALKTAIGTDNVTLTLLNGAVHADPQFVSTSNLDLVMDFLNQRLK